MSDITSRSNHADGGDEVNEHMCILDHEAGRDPGDCAMRRWVRECWNGRLRNYWIQHLEGSRYWIELDRTDFGLLKREFPDGADSALLADVLRLFKDGADNLSVMSWAVDAHRNVEVVLRILTSLDINSSRLLSRFEEPPSRPEDHSAMLVRAQRILTRGPEPADLLPVPHDLRDAAERELVARPVPPAVFWKNLLDATLRRHHAGRRVVTLRLQKGVVVLAVGSNEVAAFLNHFPPETRGGAATENW